MIDRHCLAIEFRVLITADGLERAEGVEEMLRLFDQLLLLTMEHAVAMVEMEDRPGQ